MKKINMEQNKNISEVSPPGDDEINLLDYWKVIKKRQRFILVLFFVSAFTAGVISLFMPKIYQAKASIIPLESSSGSLSYSISNLAQIAGVPIGGKGSPKDKLVSVLESRTVAERVIDGLDLIKVLYPDKQPLREDAIKALQKGMVKISSDKKGLITIAVEYKDPALAAKISNQYIKELDNFLQANSITLAKRQRIHLEGQIARIREDLTKAEESFKQFQKKYKAVAIEKQADAAVKGLADLKAQIVARDARLRALKGIVTERHPDIIMLEDETKALKAELNKLEQGSHSEAGSSLTLTGAPSIALGYGRSQRDVMFLNEELKILTQLYEQVKFEETREDISFQTIDRAVP
ncbi:MAG: hypothetical protein HZA07_06205, partial [Nitrospirae bacterium]|nr:hypothetical protein [Nitrospirota bacterium]